jgi:hypothetical protein
MSIRDNVDAATGVAIKKMKHAGVGREIVADEIHRYITLPCEYRVCRWWTI